MEVRSSITVQAGVEEVYRLWRDIATFPTFMYHLESVTVLDQKRSHWVAKAPAHTTVEWDAEITDDVPGDRVAWRSLAGSSIETDGQVRFRPAPGDRGTEV